METKRGIIEDKLLLYFKDMKICDNELAKNPCKAVGSIGKSNADAIQIWTLDQFEQFIG